MHLPTKWDGVEPRLRAYLVAQGWTPEQATHLWYDLLRYTADAPVEADACFTLLASASGCTAGRP